MNTRFSTPMHALLLLLVSGPALARSDLHLDGVRGPASVTLQIRVQDEPGDWPIQNPELVGFDVFRTTTALDGNGRCSQQTVRLNADPFPRLAIPAYEHQLIDAGLAERTLYSYRVVPVDAERQPNYHSYDFETWYSSESVNFGPALLGEGVFEGMWLWDLYVWACPGACGYGGPARALPQAGNVLDGRYYRYYGSVEQYGGPLGGVWRQVIEAVEPMECTTLAVEPTNWGLLKTRYR